MNKEELEEIKKGLTAGLGDSLKGVFDKISERKPKADELVVDIRKGGFQVLADITDIPMGEILLKKSYECSDIEKSFQNWNDDCLIIADLVKNKNESRSERMKVLKIFQKGVKFFGNRSEFAKAMDTTTAGAGAEFLPTNFSSQLIDKFELALRIPAVHERIVMTSDTFKLPAIQSFPVAIKGGENVTSGDTNVGTRNITLDAEKIAVRTLFSYELTEDSIIPIMPLIRNKIVEALVRGIEDAIINGDTAGTHQDNDVTLANDVRKLFDGYRKLTLAGTQIDLSTFNYENLIDIRKKMGIFGVNPMDLMWVMGPVVHSKLLTLKDSSNNAIFVSLDKLGPQAPLIKGSVGKFVGSDVVVSGKIREDLNASGVFDGAVTTKTIIICVNVPAFAWGSRRELLVETDKDISLQRNEMVSSMRMDFVDLQDAANNPIVGIGDNISI